MSRRQQQFDELRDLCRSGGVARAVDLAFEHFATFGRDAEVVDLLGAALEQTVVPDDLLRRFAELAAAS